MAVSPVSPADVRGGARLALERITKAYGTGYAVRDLDLNVEPGEFVTLLGASGSGKTTSLMMLAGFTTPDSGRVLIGDRDVTALPPGKRDLGVVFQNYSLFPHMTVAQNLAFPLEMRGTPRAAITREVQRILEVVQLGDKGGRFPRELSGGQQQRVALARAIIFSPKALLMDEPLGALDKNLREHMQLEIKRLHASLGSTIVFVTHDQEEALTMSDRVAVMQDGAIAQIASPRDIYQRPASRWVAGFIGASNFLNGRVVGRDGDAQLVELASGERVRAPGEAGTMAVGERVCGVVRPESVQVRQRTTDAAAGHAVHGTVREALYLGHTTKLNVALADGTTLMTQGFSDFTPEPGTPVTVGWAPEAIWFVPDTAETA